MTMSELVPEPANIEVLNGEVLGMAPWILELESKATFAAELYEAFTAHNVDTSSASLSSVLRMAAALTQFGYPLQEGSFAINTMENGYKGNIDPNARAEVLTATILLKHLQPLVALTMYQDNPDNIVGIATIMKNIAESRIDKTGYRATSQLLQQQGMQTFDELFRTGSQVNGVEVINTNTNVWGHVSEGELQLIFAKIMQTSKEK
jgi:hypothetical protein